jgi:hypothetical protein
VFVEGGLRSQRASFYRQEPPPKSDRLGLAHLNSETLIPPRACFLALIIRFRSPPTPLKKGGARVLKVPLFKGDLGGSLPKSDRSGDYGACTKPLPTALGNGSVIALEVSNFQS